MNNTQTDGTSQIKAAYDAQKREAAELAEYPEMVNGLLESVFDEDEFVRADAARMLTLLPETMSRYTLVRETLVTAFQRETSAAIKWLLVQKVGEFARGGDGVASQAFQALQDAARSDASIAVQRWCLFSLAQAHNRFVNEAIQFLTTFEDSSGENAADVEESLTILRSRERLLRPKTLSGRIAAFQQRIARGLYAHPQLRRQGVALASLSFPILLLCIYGIRMNQQNAILNHKLAIEEMALANQKQTARGDVPVDDGSSGASGNAQNDSNYDIPVGRFAIEARLMKIRNMETQHSRGKPTAAFYLYKCELLKAREQFAPDTEGKKEAAMAWKRYLDLLRAEKGTK